MAEVVARPRDIAPLAEKDALTMLLKEATDGTVVEAGRRSPAGLTRQCKYLGGASSDEAGGRVNLHFKGEVSARIPTPP